MDFHPAPSGASSPGIWPEVAASIKEAPKQRNLSLSSNLPPFPLLTKGYLHEVLTRLPQENQQDQQKVDCKAQVKSELAALCLENKQLKQKHEQELADLRREDQELKQKIERMDRLHGASMHHMKWNLNKLWSENADGRNQLANLQYQNHQYTLQQSVDKNLKELEDPHRGALTQERNENKAERFRLTEIFKRKLDEEVRLRSELTQQLNEVSNKNTKLTNMQRENWQLHREDTREIKELRLKLDKVTRALKDAHENFQEQRDVIEQIKVNHAAHIGFMETCNATSPAANLETKLDSARKTIRGLETQLESMRSRLLPAIESRLEAFQQDQQKRAALKEQLSTHRLQTILFADAFPNLGADQQNLNKRQKTHPGFYLQGPKKMMSHPKVLKQVDALKRTIQSFTQQKLSG